MSAKLKLSHGDLLAMMKCHLFPSFWSKNMAKISKPDANPAVAAILAFFWGLGHLIINGQQKKFIMVLIAGIVGSFLCCIPGLVVAIASIIDAYKTAEKLKAGKEIDENEYSFELLYKIMKFIHKDAVFVP
jgi:hypothetical protein